MAAKLVAEEGSLKGLVLSLEDGDQWVIGRDPDACQLLIEDPSASRKHLICRTTPKGILVENLSETNPVQVNDEEIKEPRLLQNGDAVKIGAGTFRFYAEAAAHLFANEEKEKAALKEAISQSEVPSDDEEIEYDIEESDTDKPAEGRKTSEQNKEEQNPEKLKQDKDNAMGTEAAEETPNLQDAPSTNIEKEDLPKSPPMEPETKEQLPSEQAQNPLTDLKDVPTHPDSIDEPKHDSIYEDEPSEKHSLAEINFGLLDTGRWLLKVISGPNNGAEFSMQTGNSYVIGTDPNACDIVFHDTSVSRQHARITVSQEDVLTIEDLKSRNGTMVDGTALKGKQPLIPNVLVAVGTTSFIVFDREGEMQTIISPLMPSIVKVLQNEVPKKEEPEPVAATQPTEPISTQEQPQTLHPPHPTITAGALILIGILTGLFVIVGIGTSTLFRSEPVTITQAIDPYKSLEAALAPFPNVKFTFNQNTGQLLLVGHVLSTTDKSQLMYTLQGLPFIKSLDDSSVVIDEYVWREINQVLENNPDWKGINVMSTTPGHFVVSGYLQTRNQADRLNEYLNANFPYPELLEKKIIVDQEILGAINGILQSKGLKNLTTKLDNGEVSITGGIPTGKAEDMNAALTEIKDVRGVRGIRNLTTGIAPEQAIVNISDKYDITGISNLAGKLSVVINGRILMQGDSLDGMTVTSIQSNVIYLEKDGTKYKIDFKR